MKSKSTIIFIVYFIISSIPEIVLSQDFFYEGYIIIQNKDTIKGKIKDLGLKKNSLLCVFIPDNSNVISKYKPGEIYSYHVKNKYYVSKHIIQENSDIQLFAEYLVDGILDLYNVVIDNETFYLFEDVDSTQYLVNMQKKAFSTDKNDLIENNNLYSKKLGTLKVIMQDYPPIFEQVDNVYLANTKSVVRLVKDYHDGICTNEKYTDYTKKEIKAELFIGFTFGLHYPIINFTGDNYFKYLIDAETERKLAVSYGLDFSLTLPSLNERISVDFLFIKSKESFVFNYSNDFDAVTNFELNLHSYSILLNYILMQKKVNITPYIGASYIRIFNHKETNYIELGYYRNPFEFSNGFATFNCGINFDIPLYTKWDLYFRAKVGYKISFTPLENYVYVSEVYQNLMFGLTLFKKITLNNK